MEKSIIKFCDVEKAFKENKVLKKLNIDIPFGKISFIIGKSGEGKSVTIKHIAGTLQPDAGEIWINGHPMHNATEMEWREQRRKLGYLFQDGALFDSLSVMENISFPLVYAPESIPQKTIKQKTEILLEKLGLEQLSKALPHQLSITEKKKVGLARALILEPEILLYDEPTTSMDPLVSNFIDELIQATQKENKKLTSIVISHDVKSILSMADHIYLLRDGVIYKDGTPEEFRTSQDPYVRYFLTGKNVSAQNEKMGS